MDHKDLEALIRKALNVLFINNPVGTSLGFLFGLILSGCYNFFIPLLKETLSPLVNWEALNKLFWMSASVFGFNVKPFLERNKVDESIIKALDFISSQQEEGLITKEQAKFQYQRLQNQVVSNAVLKTEQRTRAERISSNITDQGDE